MSQNLYEAIIHLLPYKEVREKVLPEIQLNRTHQGANFWDSPLKLLPLELQRHPEAGVGCLKIPIW